MVLYGIYQIALYDTSGTRLAIIDDYRSLQYQKIVNGPGFFTLILNALDPKISLFENNSIIEVKRKIPGVTGWYTDFVGHVENDDETLFQNSNHQMIYVGSGLNGLLGRRIIAYRDGTSQSQKNAASETVMKEYVRENIGDLATVANGRLANGVLTNFSVETSGGNGITWAGEKSGKSLLETLQDIANFSEIDFSVETDTDIGSYIFKIHVGQLGDDRTTFGLNSTTGLNAAGNPPHVFSPERGNVQTARRAMNRRREKNRVYVFGRGAGATRDIEYEENATEIDVNNLNLKEVMRGAASQTGSGLNALANEQLELLSAEERFEFIPLDTQSSLYGVHYFLGDLVTVRLRGVERDKKLVSVSITISPSGENKTMQFKDIPR